MSFANHCTLSLSLLAVCNVGFAAEEGHAHQHRSPSGAPMIHSFRLEPAFVERGLFLDYGFSELEDGNESELELELEWAFNDEWGMIVELPYLMLDPDGGPIVEGFGDLAISPRKLLHQSDRFLMTLGIEVEIPTGDEDRGLGGGEFAVAPTLTIWTDLGAGWAFNSQFGFEHAFESDETELLLRASAIYTFGGGPSQCTAQHAHECGGRSNLLSLVLEIDGAAGLSGDESGVVEAEGIVGLDYGLSSGLDVRAGFIFPLASPSELERGFVFGVVRHF